MKDLANFNSPTWEAFLNQMSVEELCKIVEQGELQELFKNERLFVKNDVELPFLSDLSNKIMTYELIDRPIYDIEEMVDEIWQ